MPVCNRTTTVAVVLAAAVLVGCGPADLQTERPADIENAIVNGELNSGDPAVVYLDVGCTGTLVSPRVVLTACHCVENRSSTDVFFGSDRNGPGTWISSTDIEVYSYNQCIGDGDIAMVTLAEDGPADPIPINDRDLGAYMNDDVRLVGFGVVGGNSGGSGTKRQGPTKLHDLDSGVMWVGGQSAGFCYGDSGGPNFMIFEGVEHVAGVTSFTTQNCSGVGNDGSARTDTYFSFITDYIDTHDPATCDPDGRCGTDCLSVDPDCPCADDGFCTDLCTDLSTDVDCEGCGDDGVCRADCPILDEDCCGADGNCFEGCGVLDPDCEPEDPDDGNGNGDGSGNGDGNGNAGNTSSSDGDFTGDGGLVGNVACDMNSGGSDDWHLAWLMLGAIIMRRRSSLRSRAS